jgi:hypothetical protein
VTANGNVNTNSSVIANGDVTANNTLVSNTGALWLGGGGARIDAPGQLTVNASGGTLYLNPWSGTQTIVGGGGGSGQLVIAGRTFANEYVQVGGYAPIGGACTTGSIGNSGTGLAFCNNGVWQTAGQVPSGTMCGMSDFSTETNAEQNSTPCMGLDPYYVGCPSGYWRANVGAVSQHFYFACVKT